MFGNDYLGFGNSIMERYSGMISRINPLALLYLEADEKKEEPAGSQQQITYVQNVTYQTNHYFYQHIINRYINNYRLTVRQEHIGGQDKTAIAKAVLKKLIQETADTENVYAKTELLYSFKKELSDTQLLKESAQLLLKESGRESVREREKQLTLVRQTLGNVIKTAELQNIYTELSRQLIKEEKPQLINLFRLYTGEILKQTVQSLSGEEQLAKLLNCEQTYLDRVTEKITKERIEKLEAALSKTEWEKEIRETVQTVYQKKEQTITQILAQQLEPYAARNAKGISRALIRQQLVQSIRNQGLVTKISEMLWQPAPNEKQMQEEKLENMISSVAEQTEQIRNSRKKYDRQIYQRLRPLPLRPAALSFFKPEVSGDAAPKTEIIQKHLVKVVKEEHTRGVKYDTCFIDRFLKEVREQKTVTVDRRKLPAGIIYYERPDKNVRFESKDALILPAEPVEGRQLLVYEKLRYLQEQMDMPKITGMSGQMDMSKITDMPGQMDMPKITDMPGQVDMPKITGMPEQMDMSKITDMSGQMDMPQQKAYGEQALLLLQPQTAEENVERRLLHKKLPDFTALASDGRESSFSTLEVLAQSGQADLPYMQLQRPNRSTLTLLYKKEQNKAEEKESSKALEQEEEYPTDIVFTKDVVKTKKSEDTTVENRSLARINKEEGMQQTFLKPGSKMDEAVSESVYRHMEENIDEISRKVYRSLERKLKTERDRRGM